MSEIKESVFGNGNFDEQENGFLKFTPENNNTLKYKMLADEPVKKVNKFGKEQYTFEVLDMDNKKVASHTITSRRYMRDLEDYTPLSGKSFCVHRSGEELETKYQVVLIE